MGNLRFQNSCMMFTSTLTSSFCRVGFRLFQTGKCKTKTRRKYVFLSSNPAKNLWLPYPSPASTLKECFHIKPGVHHPYTRFTGEAPPLTQNGIKARKQYLNTRHVRDLRWLIKQCKVTDVKEGTIFEEIQMKPAV